MRFTHRDFRYLEYFRYLELNIKTQHQTLCHGK